MIRNLVLNALADCYRAMHASSSRSSNTAKVQAMFNLALRRYHP